eukprot:3114727-Amphidinium_carterae.1
MDIMRISKYNRSDHAFHAIYSEDGRATVGAYSTASFSQIGPSLSKADTSAVATYIESGSTQRKYFHTISFAWCARTKLLGEAHCCLVWRQKDAGCSMENNAAYNINTMYGMPDRCVMVLINHPHHVAPGAGWPPMNGAAQAATLNSARKKLCKLIPNGVQDEKIAFAVHCLKLRHANLMRNMVSGTYNNRKDGSSPTNV